MYARMLAVTLMVLTVVPIVGCSSNELKTFPVTGKVTFSDGSPVSGGTIIFSNSEKQVSATGGLGSDGSFKLSTYKADDGAPAGTYKVIVQPPRPDKPGAKPPYSLAPAFQDLVKTPLSLTVKEGDNPFDIKVEKGK